MNLILTRENPHPDCTLGFLHIPEANLTLCTLELPWIPSSTCKGGLKGKSCVPVGEYRLEKHNSVKHPFTWALVNHELDVVHYENDDHDPDEDRATCLIHVGNFASQVQGCIAVGLAHAMSGQMHMVTSSVRAMQRLKDAVPWVEHTLTIREAS